MKIAALPANESARVAAVHALQACLPTVSTSLDALTRAATTIFDVPMAAVTLISDETQCFAATVGMSASETSRDTAFCAHTILAPQTLLEVPDARLDERFQGNPAVTGDFGLRFYAGFPVSDDEGHALGALCLVDTKPRTLSPRQRTVFEELARSASSIIRAQLDAKKSADVIARISEEHFTTLESAPVGMMRVSKDGIILFANYHLEQLFGVTGSLLGEPLERLIPHRLRASHAGHLKRYVKRPATRAMGRGQTLVGLRADGTEFPIEVALTALSSGDVVAAVTDVSEREKTRELQAQLGEHQRLVTTGTLAAGVGHEINNPLSYVQTNLDFAINEVGGMIVASPSESLNDVLSSLGDAREGTDRIRRIVLGLRTLARSEQEIAPHNVNAILEVSANMAMHEIRSVASLDFQTTDVPLIAADDGQLTQVFVNLLVNAAQAFVTKDTRVNVIQVRTSLNDDGMVCIDVKDNGPGIPEKVLGRIFDPFFTTKPVGLGTGLGLAISHSLVASLDGKMTCRSVVGEGTVFSIAFPPSFLQKEPQATIELPPVPRAKILVIDDETLLLSSLERYLRREHDFVLINDSQIAKKVLLDDPTHFDLILCDIMMPHLNGFELFNEVRAIEPETASRFIFMTASWSPTELAEFLTQVDNECLEKPLKGETLSLTIRRALQRQKLDGESS